MKVLNKIAADGLKLMDSQKKTMLEDTDGGGSKVNCPKCGRLLYERDIDWTEGNCRFCRE